MLKLKVLLSPFALLSSFVIRNLLQRQVLGVSLSAALTQSLITTKLREGLGGGPGAEEVSFTCEENEGRTRLGLGWQE